MKSDEIRNKILDLLFEQYQSIPDDPRKQWKDRRDFPSQMNLPFEDIALHFQFLMDEKLIEGQRAKLRITHKGIKKIEERSKPARSSGASIVQISGGNVGQVIQARNVTFNAPVFLDRLLHELEDHPEIPQEEKNRWVGYLKEIAQHPLAVSLVQKVLDILRP